MPTIHFNFELFLPWNFQIITRLNRTPLHYAAFRGETRISEILLENGANRFSKDADNQIPLHGAATENNTETARILLEGISKAEISDQLFNIDRDGSTPLHLSVENNCEETAHYLMKTCYNSVSGSQLYSLVERPKVHSDSSKPLHLAAATNNIRLVTLLVRYYKANTEVFNNLHETPLFIACKKGFTQIMKYLIIEGKAEKESRDRDGYTNLLIACSSGHSECVEALLKLGADIEATNKEDKNAFHIVALENRPEVQNTVILKIRNQQENSFYRNFVFQNFVFQNAVFRNFDFQSYFSFFAIFFLFQVLLRHGSAKHLMSRPDQDGNTPYHLAASLGHRKLLHLLCRKPIRVDYKNEDEQTALHLACTTGKHQVINLLLTQDSSLLHDKDDDDNTAVHLACNNGHEKCLEILLKSDVNVMERNSVNWTPLDLAANSGHIECCELLLEHDHDVDPVDVQNQTPLHLASMNGHEDVVKLLLKYNADVSIKSRSGLNCLDLAIDNGHYDTVETFLECRSWKETLRSKIVRKIKNKTVVMTPMRRLIMKMPDMAEKVLSKCVIKDKKSDPDNPSFKFKFEFIDDTYYASKYIDGSGSVDKNEISDTVSLFSSDNGDSNTADYFNKSDSNRDSKITRILYDIDGNLNSESQSYNSSCSVLCENHALNLMVKFGRKELISHPLTLELLDYKWKRYGRIVYFANLTVYMLFMICFNFFMLATPAPYAFADYGSVNFTDGNCRELNEDLPEDAYAEILWI